jgi:hypothetical protein
MPAFWAVVLVYCYADTTHNIIHHNSSLACQWGMCQNDLSVGSIPPANAHATRACACLSLQMASDDQHQEAHHVLQVVHLALLPQDLQLTAAGLVQNA